MFQEVAARCPGEKATAKDLLDFGSRPVANLSACIRRAGGEVLHLLCSSLLPHTLGVQVPEGFHSTGQKQGGKAVTPEFLHAQQLW